MSRSRKKGRSSISCSARHVSVLRERTMRGQRSRKTHQVGHARAFEVDNDDNLQLGVVSVLTLTAQVREVPPPDLPPEPRIVLERVERPVVRTLDVPEVEDGARAPKAVDEVRVEEEERLGEVQRVDRGRGEVLQRRGEAPADGRVQELEGRGGGEASPAAEPEHGHCAASGMDGQR